jgi:formylglycine-generating enzyme required for sulfatase activity
VGPLRLVPAGSFTQGSLPTEIGRTSGIEGPPFLHTLTKNIAVMESSVTGQMWSSLRAVQGTLPADPTCSGIISGPSRPVTCIFWYEAMLFANLLSKQEALTPAYRVGAAAGAVIDSSNYVTHNVYADWNANGFRLPTEGEREYFTRAGTTGPFFVTDLGYNSASWNSCNGGVLPVLESVTWFCANSGIQMHPAGLKGPNTWGLRNVHGNVFEWCWEWLGDYAGDKTDYRGPSSGTYRVFRGGSWAHNPAVMRSAYRGSAFPGNTRYSDVGFRLVRTVN